MFLRARTRGIGLCLFETEACLNYGPKDLPEEAGRFQWHVHLPLDLPWDAGGAAVAAICARLREKVDYLRPVLAVLHPPQKGDKRALLAEFAAAWDFALPVALENVAWCDVIGLGEAFLERHNFGFCLDVAHALCYGQERTLASELPERAAILHWSAPAGADRHLPLTELTAKEMEIAGRVMTKSRPDAIHLLEIFDWPNVEKSLPVLDKMFSLSFFKRK